MATGEHSGNTMYPSSTLEIEVLIHLDIFKIHCQYIQMCNNFSTCIIKYCLKGPRPGHWYMMTAYLATPTAQVKCFPHYILEVEDRIQILVQKKVDQSKTTVKILRWEKTSTTASEYEANGWRVVCNRLWKMPNQTFHCNREASMEKIWWGRSSLSFK